MNIIIIGKKSFLGSNLNLFLKKKKINCKLFSFQQFIKNYQQLSKIDFIINFSIKRDYVTKKYNIINDLDYKISKLIASSNIKYIMISSRKVYDLTKNSEKIKENQKLVKKNIYSINKIKTEKKLLKLLKRKLIILRLSNVIGIRKKSKNTVHKTYSDIFFSNSAKKIFLINDKKDFKDFISINTFLETVYKIFLIKNIYGIFNLSIGRKVYLKDINNWLNHYNKQKKNNLKINVKNNENFYLSNSKIIKKIGNIPGYKKLKKDCLEISKLYFDN